MLTVTLIRQPAPPPPSPSEQAGQGGELALAGREYADPGAGVARQSEGSVEKRLAQIWASGCTSSAAEVASACGRPGCRRRALIGSAGRSSMARVLAAYFTMPALCRAGAD